MSKVPKKRSLHIFAIFQKKRRVKVIFLHADKNESFLQIGTMIFDGDRQAFPKFPK